jgi:hypothetical protein
MNSVPYSRNRQFALRQRQGLTVRVVSVRAARFGLLLALAVTVTSVAS